MSKAGRKFDTTQLSILDLLRNLAESSIHPTAEGQFRVVDRLRQTMRSAIKDCPLSRHQIAGEMSHLVGQSISKEQIDSWTRESDEMNGRPARHIPAEFLPAFCKVTGNHEPLGLLGELVGLFVLPGPEALRAEIQKLDEQARDLQARKRQRLLFLKEMERGR